ncbi:Putative cellulose synthase 3 [Fulvia fulva]|uniref:Cellulose synthase 3 n=1 Tax=Passalora fulva TaxID=5499 RepID=A0A9Q8P4V6_PASFU|nr:Putative cellulose synthase 3 [Fulvia fulva]UJO13231.1 Putative cellulose synthase 3 [Fulvia fulva]
MNMPEKHQFVVEQTDDLLPLSSERQRQRRVLAEASWRPLTLATWLLQATLVYQLSQNIQHARRGTRTLVPILFVCWQIILLATGALEEGWRFCISGKVKQRRKTRLVGDQVPFVDIIIVCCGEELDVILDTVRAACAQDYPGAQLRVLVADDGNDDLLEGSITALGKTSPCQLLYHRRPGKAGSKKGYKAGNMNSALVYADSVHTGNPVEFCAFLDCDMIVERDFLRACLGHLILEPNAGVVIVPQSFYNLPRNDPLYQSMHVHNWLDQVQHDTLDSTWETGPGVVFRRQAISNMDGFDEWVLMEDVIAGMLLNGLGWKTDYCYEQLQWGLIPDDLAAHIAQRKKWVVGTVRGAMIAAFGFHRTRMAQLSWRQRTVQVCYCIGPYVSAIHRTLLPLAFLLLMASKEPLVVSSHPIQLDRMLHIGFLIGICYRAQSMVTGYHCGYRMARRRTQGAIWLSPYLLVTIIKEFLPKCLAGLPMRFVPTGRLNSNLQERNSGLRATVWRRLIVMIIQQGLWYHLLVGTSAVSLLYRDYMSAQTHASRGDMCQHIWTHALAPGVDWLVYVDLLAPIMYALLPPIVSPRRELLEQTVVSGLETWHPAQSRRVEEWSASFWFEECPWIVAYAVCVYLRTKTCTT